MKILNPKNTPRQRTGSLLLMGILLALGLLLMPSAVSAQTGGTQSDGPGVHWNFGVPAQGEPFHFGAPLPQDPTVFDGDLKVSGGESYAGDVVVYRGDVNVEGGGRIGGNLYVYSGDVEIKGGGTVGGDVIAYGGDVTIDGGGRVGGNVQALGGDVDLVDGSTVGGDVSVLGGSIDRAAGAVVGGNVLSGPDIAIPDLPFFPGGNPERAPSPDQLIPVQPNMANDGGRRGGFIGWLLGFVLDLFRAAFITLVAVIGAGLVMVNRPALVDKGLALLEADLRTATGVGLLANMVVMIPLWMWLGSLSAGFLVALCLSPLLLPLGLIALAIELAGLAIGGRWLGNRIAEAVGTTLDPLPATAVGVTLIIGAVGFLWALASCLGWLLLILVGAPGVGALVLHWQESRTGQAGSPKGKTVSPDLSSAPVPAEPVEAAPALDADAIQDLLDEQALPNITPGAVQVEDFDFTQIVGIGPVFSMRLRAANIRTLGDLAGMTPDALADVLNVSEERVIRNDLLGQARRLLGLE